jgi:hypothetical protein
VVVSFVRQRYWAEFRLMAERGLRAHGLRSTLHCLERGDIAAAVERALKPGRS